MPVFGKASLDRLSMVHPDLARLCLRVVEHVNCVVVCGHRGQVDQDKAFDEGKSKLKWPNGQHNKLPSMAVDMVPYPINWDDPNQMRVFAGFVLGVAAMMDLEVRWGGDWDRDWDVKDNQFNDFPHFELLEK